MIPPPPRLARVRWTHAYRIIPSRHPPIDVFESLGDSDLLAGLEMLTNPRLRDQWGEIALVPAERRVTGSGATYVMAPFTHPNRQGSRFSDGTYGVYYAAHRLETAIRETVHHMSLFYSATNDPPHQEDFRALVGSIDHRVHDIRDDAPDNIMDPDSYAHSQPFARALRDSGSDGIVYESVRDRDHYNLAAFWPDVVGIPVQERHLIYAWDGNRIERLFDQQTETWYELD